MCLKKGVKLGGIGNAKACGVAAGFKFPARRLGHLGLLFFVGLCALPAAGQIQFYYSVFRGAATITGFNGGPVTVITIPSTIDGYPVVGLADNAFGPSDRAGLTQLLVIPQSVTNIGRGVLAICLGLTNVVVDPLNPAYSTVDGVLLNKNETVLIDYPRGKRGDYAIPPTVSIVLSNAFGEYRYGSRVSGITIPSGVTSIGDEAFIYCRDLTNVTWMGSVTSVTNLGIFLFANCTKLGSIEIPNGFRIIPGACFDSCSSLTKVVIPPTVEDIGIAAFRGCSGLRSAVIPSSVTHISDMAFLNCSQLTALYFEGPVPSMGDGIYPGAFDGVPYLTNFFIPGAIGWGATLGGRPTAPWLPSVDVRSGSFGVQAGLFGFEIFWAKDQAVVIEANGSLSNVGWSPLTTNVLSGNIYYFTDPDWTNYSQRFYRVHWP
jgi:hypothetical protein